MRHRRASLILVAMPILLLGCQAKSTTPYRPESEQQVSAPAEKVEGRSWKEWTVVWWQRSLGMNKSQHPMEDRKGEHVARSQTGNVWFLHGTTGGEAQRKCKIPAGKYLFFPILTSLVTGAEDERNVMRYALVIDLNDAIMHVKLNGKMIPVRQEHRISTPAFNYKLPKDDREYLYDGLLPGEVAMAEGYWLMLKPLSAGKHTLEFSGKIENGEHPFETKVKYELEVEGEVKDTATKK